MIKYFVDIINDNVYIFKRNEEYEFNYIPEIIYSSSANYPVYTVDFDKLNHVVEHEDYIYNSDSGVLIHGSLEDIINKLGLWVLHFKFELDLLSQPKPIFQRFTYKLFSNTINIEDYIYFYLNTTNNENKISLLPHNILNDILLCLYSANNTIKEKEQGTP